MVNYHLSCVYSYGMPGSLETDRDFISWRLLLFIVKCWEIFCCWIWFCCCVSNDAWCIFCWLWLWLCCWLIGWFWCCWWRFFMLLLWLFDSLLWVRGLSMSDWTLLWISLKIKIKIKVKINFNEKKEMKKKKVTWACAKLWWIAESEDVLLQLDSCGGLK